MPPFGPQGFSRKAAGAAVWPLVQRLLLTHRKNDRNDKCQSKVEIHSNEWSDYLNMQLTHEDFLFIALCDPLLTLAD